MLVKVISEGIEGGVYIRRSSFDRGSSSSSLASRWRGCFFLSCLLPIDSYNLLARPSRLLPLSTLASYIFATTSNISSSKASFADIRSSGTCVKYRVWSPVLRCLCIWRLCHRSQLESGIFSCPISSPMMEFALTASALTLLLRPSSSSVLRNLSWIGEDVRIRH